MHQLDKEKIERKRMEGEEKKEWKKSVMRVATKREKKAESESKFEIKFEFETVRSDGRVGMTRTRNRRALQKNQRQNSNSRR